VAFKQLKSYEYEPVYSVHQVAFKQLKSYEYEPVYSVQRFECLNKLLVLSKIQ